MSEILTFNKDKPTPVDIINEVAKHATELENVIVLMQHKDGGQRIAMSYAKLPDICAMSKQLEFEIMQMFGDFYGRQVSPPSE